MPDPGDGLFEEPGKSKKRDKVPSAWISFVGRIVAQIIGAIALAFDPLFEPLRNDTRYGRLMNP